MPFALVKSMLRSADALADVELVHIHGLGKTPWIDPEYEQVFRTNSFFLTPALRDAVERGQADYTPCPMSEVASLFVDGPLPLDVALIQVTPPDDDGWCSLGVSVDVVKAAVKCARVVIAQVIAGFRCVRSIGLSNMRRHCRRRRVKSRTSGIGGSGAMQRN